MAKKNSKEIEMIVLADEVVYNDKTYKQGQTFKLNIEDPVAEGLVGASAVMDHAAYKKQIAEMEEAEKAEESEDGTR